MQEHNTVRETTCKQEFRLTTTCARQHCQRTFDYAIPYASVNFHLSLSVLKAGGSKPRLHNLIQGSGRHQITHVLLKSLRVSSRPFLLRGLQQSKPNTFLTTRYSASCSSVKHLPLETWQDCGKIKDNVSISQSLCAMHRMFYLKLISLRQFEGESDLALTFADQPTDKSVFYPSQVSLVLIHIRGRREGLVVCTRWYLNHEHSCCTRSRSHLRLRLKRLTDNVVKSLYI